MNFRRLTLIFFILLLGLNVAGIAGCNAFFICRYILLFYLALILIYLGISVTFAFFPCTCFHHPVVCKGKQTGNKVAITFDDGPDPQNTPVILDVLKKNGVSATFFCIGSRIEGNEAIVEAIREQGRAEPSPAVDSNARGWISSNFIGQRVQGQENRRQGDHEERRQSSETTSF